jgi:hypothetical protein
MFARYTCIFRSSDADEFVLDWILSVVTTNTTYEQDRLHATGDKMDLFAAGLGPVIAELNR